MSAPTLTNDVAELQQQIRKLQAENEELRKQRRSLLLMVFPPDPNEHFDPSEYHPFTFEDLMADFKKIDDEMKAG